MAENARETLSRTESPEARLARLQGRHRAPEVVLDDEAMTVYVDGEERYLRTTEFRAFRLLWQHRGDLILHKNIVLAAGTWVNPEWYDRPGARYPGARWQGRSRNLICEIRKVLGDAVDIRGRHGIGYRIERER